MKKTAWKSKAPQLVKDDENELQAGDLLEADENDISPQEEELLDEAEELISDEERERRHKRVAAIVSIVVSALCVGVGLFLTWYLLIVDTIQIKGNSDITSEEILAASGLETGKHIWLQNTNTAKAAIEDMPYIGTAEVKRVYPDKLVITVTERKEAAVVMGMNTDAVIDKDGNVLFVGTRASYEGLMSIVGLGASGFKLNTPLGDDSTFQIRTTLALLSAISNAGLVDSMDYLDVSNSLSVYLVTTSGLRVQLGQPDSAEEKLYKLKLVLPKLKQMGLDTKGTIDVSTVGDPVYSPPTNTLVGDQPITIIPQATGTDAASPTDAQDSSRTDAPGASPVQSYSPDATASMPPATPEPTLNYDGFSG